jgi:hypothetical protein
LHTTAAAVSFRPSQQLKPQWSTHVSHGVKELDSQMKPQGETLSRRYVKVAPPTVHAGVGDALRQAFRMDGQIRSLKPFEELLGQLD